MPDVLADIWDNILRHLKKFHSEQWRNWFEFIEPISFENGVLRIGAIENSHVQYLMHDCYHVLQEAVQRVTGYLCTVTIVLTEGKNLNELVEDNAAVAKIEMLYLSPDYTFNNFVVGPCNRLSHAASIAVSEAPGETYNPLFIHGDVGLGKTHLLQAACHAITKRDRNAKILYMSCETFVNHFIQAVEEGDLYDFRYKYRHVDMLVIDDIQFLADRERSQEEFFHTFNTLYQSRKQIIISADCSPSEIPNLEDRLVSRFSQGLVTRVDKPCFETRMAILHKKAQLRSINVPEEIVCFIARKIENNTRELEGALTKIYGMAMLHDGEITLDLARQVFGDDQTTVTRIVTITQIIDVVTDYFDVRLNDLQSKRRSRSIVFPRQICMYLARDLTRLSLEEIGGYFGGRDHTTVLHGYRNIDRLLDHDQDVRVVVDGLVTTLTRAS